MLLFLWHWPGSHDCVGCPRDDESNNVDYRHLESLHCRPVQSITSSTNNLIADRFQPWWEFVMVGICLWAIFFLLPKRQFRKRFQNMQEPLHEPTCGVCWAHLTESEEGRWEWSVELSPSPTSDPRTLISGHIHCVLKKINNKKWTISLPHALLSYLRWLLFRYCSSLPMIFRRCFQIPSLVGPHAWQDSRLNF